MKRYLTLLFALFIFLMSGCCTKHEFSPATCISPATCVKCGETEGEALGHDWVEATCTEPKTCATCGLTTGESLGHEWSEPTCIDPKTCSRCGALSGNPLGHKWADATCTEPKTCTTCGVTEGKALGHSVDSWETVSESTCTEAGIESGICTVCGETIEQEKALKDHTASDWVVIEQPTKDSEGIHIKECKVCGAELERETFELSAEELKQLYISNCKYISYSDLSRTPDDYKDSYVKFSGRVLQVCSEASSPIYYSTYRVATSGNYDGVVYLCVDNYGSGSRILEDDYITFYGTFDGLYSYQTVLGASLTIPKIIAEYVD